MKEVFMHVPVEAGLEGGGYKEPFSGQVSLCPRLFWPTGGLPDVNLLPSGGIS